MNYVKWITATGEYYSFQKSFLLVCIEYSVMVLSSEEGKFGILFPEKAVPYDNCCTLMLTNWYAFFHFYRQFAIHLSSLAQQ